jgi:hypothetical protein
MCRDAGWLTTLSRKDLPVPWTADRVSGSRWPRDILRAPRNAIEIFVFRSRHRPPDSPEDGRRHDDRHHTLTGD